MKDSSSDRSQGRRSDSPSDRALDLAFDLRDTPKADRAQAIQRACGGDRELERQVAALLEASDDPGDFLNEIASSTVSTEELLQVSIEPEGIPEIQGYQIIAELGRGGMGVVYQAVDLENANRSVALKVLPPLFDQAARVRFDDECRAMANLMHPNIATLYHSGIAGDRPFVAMELIDGLPIDEFCDAYALSIDQRIQLVEQLCFAIAHAHERRMLHQDIKPANLLVTPTTGSGALLKVIDFGIAAILGDAHTTDVGRSSKGSLGYVSPERAMDPSRFRADTREDVYSIGVILFKLLSGMEPPKPDHHEPRDPAHTVSLLTASQQNEVASDRSLEVERWLKVVRGDLGKIAAKAVLPNREKRYRSPLALAEDLRRYRENRPITARSATKLYVFKKTLQRNLLGAVGIGLAVLALLVGGAATSLALIRALDSEQAALAQAEAAEAARQAAETSRQEAQQTADFLVDLFGRSRPNDPEITRPPSEVTAMEMLERGTARIESQLAEQPLLQSRMQATFGQMYHDIAEYEAASQQLDAALDRMRDPAAGLLADAAPIEFIRMLLARSDTALQQSAHEDAERLLLEAASIQTDSNSTESMILAAQVQQNLGRMYRVRGELERSREHWTEAVRLNQAVFGAEHRRTLSAQYGLAQVFFSSRRWPEAEAQLRSVLKGFEGQLPDNHSRILTVRTALGGALASQDKLDEAAVILEDVLQGLRLALGNEHPRVADTLNNLGVTYDDMGQLDKALSYHNEALAIRRAAFGENNPAVAWSLDNLAYVQVDLEDLALAEELQSQALTIRLDRLGEDHLDTARSYSHLAELARLRGDYANAIELQQQSLSIYQRNLETDHPSVVQQTIDLGLLYWLDGQHDSARAQIEPMLSALRQSSDTQQDTLEDIQEELEQVGYTPDFNSGL